MSLILLKKAVIDISKGIPVTLMLTFISGGIGVVIAVLVNIGRKYKVLNILLQFYVLIFTGVPLFLQLFFIYYGLGSLLSNVSTVHYGILEEIFQNAFFYALIALTLNTGAYGSNIIQSAIKAIPKGQTEAALSLGFSKWQIFRRILCPQAFYYALPSYSNELVLLVKATSLASVITVMDITGYMQQFFSANYLFYEPFLVAATYYMLINYSIIYIIKKIERRKFYGKLTTV